MALSLNAPIEDLKLSNRVRNVLHLNGLHTVDSLLKCDYNAALRGFGPGARAELSSALEFNGFLPPAGLNPADSGVIAGEISKLFEQMEGSFQKWSARILHFETRIRELTATEPGHGPAAERSGQRMLAAVSGAAHEFRTRLTALRLAGTGLLAVANLPAEQQEMVAIVEEESIRLSALVCNLIEMLPLAKSPPSFSGRTKGAPEPGDARARVRAGLALEPQLQPRPSESLRHV